MNDRVRYTLSTKIDLPGPFWRCVELFGTDECAFLLDSGLNEKNPGRYSYLGRRPAALLTGRRLANGKQNLAFELQTWRRPDGQSPDAPDVDFFEGDPFGALRDLSARYGGPDTGNGQIPFTQGLVGYFGYETAYSIENLPDTGANDLNLPALTFMLIDELLAYDHAEEQATLHVTGWGPNAQAIATERTAQWQVELNGLVFDKTGEVVAPLDDSTAPRAHFNREQYQAAVQQCREHILAGDVFEVCLTQRLEMDLKGSAWELYGILREINPAPFASYLQLPEFQVVSASPERFLKLDAGGSVESRPIKGTRARGETPEADAQLKAELGESEKDQAENIMIVDLVRNDLGKVCQIGSVSVPELQVVETYATVHQLVSTVRGELKPEYDAFDLVRACFPGGSMTGAPKIEAMKIIDSIEPVKRGIYSGALGFIDAGGAMDLGMVIRTIVCQDNVATFGVGGAVVSDSDPDAEYEETMDKARAMIAAISTLNNGGAA